MQKILVLLLLTGCVLASDKDKGGSKDKGRDTNKEMNGWCNRHMDRKGLGDHKDWLCNNGHGGSGNGGNGGGNKQTSGNPNGGGGR